MVPGVLNKIEVIIFVMNVYVMISWENIQEECFLENLFEEEKDV